MCWLMGWFLSPQEISTPSLFWSLASNVNQDWSHQGVWVRGVPIQGNVGSLLKCKAPDPQIQDILWVILMQMVLQGHFGRFLHRVLHPPTVLLGAELDWIFLILRECR